MKMECKPLASPPAAPFADLAALRDWHQHFVTTHTQKAKRYAATANHSTDARYQRMHEHHSTKAKMHQTAVDLLNAAISPAKLAA